MFCNRVALAATASLLHLAPPASAQADRPPTTRERDGAHDFDFEIGVWTTAVRYLVNPLSPDVDRWVEYQGTSAVRSLMGGQANLVELDVASSSGAIRGISLRLYNPRTRQWTLNFASMSGGQLTPPVYGRFDAAGRGLFYGQDSVEGRAVLVRFVITPEGRDTIRFVQSFSADAGSTWEDNWIAVDRRR
jgi:hypothetical protein